MSKKAVDVAKNYLAAREIQELNRLTTILLDIFEDQLDIGKLTTMAEAGQLLDQQLANLNRAVLRRGGSIKSSAAQQHAYGQYEKFKEKQKALRHAQADADIAELKAQAKTVSKGRKPGRRAS